MTELTKELFEKMKKCVKETVEKHSNARNILCEKRFDNIYQYVNDGICDIAIPILNKTFIVYDHDLENHEYIERLIEVQTMKAIQLQDKIVIYGHRYDEESIIGLDNIIPEFNIVDKSFTLNINREPYIYALELQYRLHIKGFELKFLLMNPKDYGDMCVIIPGISESHIDLIKRNLCDNIIVTNIVNEGTIYGGDYGEDIAALIITTDFDLLYDWEFEKMSCYWHKKYFFRIIDRSVPVFYRHRECYGKNYAFGKIVLKDGDIK